ncbi:hypothetical protein FJZ53_01225 [Candidatus Woesearchaeota archaeon]|nr:hypothetical protein [Candidatus Woesearchaeota archaeon]
MVKVDCHLHTKYSKEVVISHPLAYLVGAKESYLEPEKAYKLAKDKGMDFVAITDHDSIDGALILNDKYSDIIMGEELEVKASDEGHLVHLLVYDINEKQHEDLTDLKKIGLKDTCKYLRKNAIVHSLAHLSYKSSKPDLSVKLIDEWMKHVQCLEIMNGGVSPIHNRFAKVVAYLYGKSVSGGSDAHTDRTVSSVYTISEKAKTKKEFLSDLRMGNVLVEGENYDFKEFLKTSLRLTGNALFDIVLRPAARKRTRLRKYFLDYLVSLFVVTPVFTLVAPGLTIAYLHHKAQDLQISKLEKELLEHLSTKFYGSFKQEYEETELEKEIFKN